MVAAGCARSASAGGATGLIGNGAALTGGKEHRDGAISVGAQADFT